MTDRQFEITVAFDGYRSWDLRPTAAIEPDWILIRHSPSSPLTTWVRWTHARITRRDAGMRYAIHIRFDKINRGRWPAISYARKREHADPKEAQRYRERTLELESIGRAISNNTTSVAYTSHDDD